MSTPCIRCGACQPVCPVGLLPDLLYSACDNTAPAQPDALRACIECGLCNRACPSGIDLVAAFHTAKSDLQQREDAKARARRAAERFERHARRTALRARENSARRQARLQREHNW